MGPGELKEYAALLSEVKTSLHEREGFGDVEEEVIFDKILERLALDPLPLSRMVYLGRRIFHSLCRMDILEDLLRDEEVTDIMVNGHQQIFYEKGGERLVYSEQFESRERLEDLIQQIVGAVNRRVNEAEPIVDARLPDGSRIHAVLPPVSLSGPVLTIRKFRENPITMEEMIRQGGSSQEVADFLKRAVSEGKNIFVCGGTSSGKTTLLNILSNYIDPKDRVVTIEDSAELRLRGIDNLVSLETRRGGPEGKGEISLRDLIRASLRMNPDRIVIGEVRGEEAFDMLSGMNTGHACLSTGHANSCADMIGRLESMVWMGADIPLESLRRQIASALDYMVYMEKQRSGIRCIKEIYRVAASKEGDVCLQEVMSFQNGRAHWQNAAV